MPVLNTTSLEDAIDLVDRSFETSKANPLDNSMRDSGFVRVSTISANSGGTRRHKELPVGDLYANDKTEGGVSTKTQVQQGYYKDTIAREYSKSIDISYKMRVLNKVGDIYNAANFIGGVSTRREDLNLSMFISFGTATSYTNMDGRTVDISTGDGLALFSTVHTLTGSSTTYRSRVANNPQLSEGGLELAEDLFTTNIYTNLGEQVASQPDILFTTNYPTTVNEAIRFLKSTSQVSAPNSGVANVFKGKYKHVILNKIDMTAAGVKNSSKRTYWGLVDSKIFGFYHDIYSAPVMKYPSSGNNGEDIDTLDWTFTVVDLHDSCVVAGRGIVFSSGDGDA